MGPTFRFIDDMFNPLYAISLPNKVKRPNCGRVTTVDNTLKAYANARKIGKQKKRIDERINLTGNDVRLVVFYHNPSYYKYY